MTVLNTEDEKMEAAPSDPDDAPPKDHFQIKYSSREFARG